MKRKVPLFSKFSITLCQVIRVSFCFRSTEKTCSRYLEMESCHGYTRKKKEPLFCFDIGKRKTSQKMFAARNIVNLHRNSKTLLHSGTKLLWFLITIPIPTKPCLPFNCCTRIWFIFSSSAKPCLPPARPPWPSPPPPRRCPSPPRTSSGSRRRWRGRGRPTSPGGCCRRRWSGKNKLIFFHPHLAVPLYPQWVQIKSLIKN